MKNNLSKVMNPGGYKLCFPSQEDAWIIEKIRLGLLPIEDIWRIWSQVDLLLREWRLRLMLQNL